MMKHQITSTNIQINNNLQTLNNKTVHYVRLDFVIVHWNLFVICYLFFGIFSGN